MQNEQELARLTIKSSGGKGKSSITLTSTRIFARLDNGFFGKADTTIALQAVDAIFNGWKRNPLFLWLGLGGILTGLFGVVAEEPVLMSAIIIGFIFLLAFFLNKTIGIEIHSGTTKIGGRPTSQNDAEAFVTQVLEAISSR